MRTQSAPTIRLKNYTPPAYTITDVDLQVSLHPQQTRVKSRLTIVRQKGTVAGHSLKLDGDELSLVSISVDEKLVPSDGYRVEPQSLELKSPPKTRQFVLEIETELAPAENKKLMGLYQSSGVYCTQCEAEGFRRITYFLDRPDVLAIYTVRLDAGRTECPQLLSNGNLVKKGKLANDRHYAVWHDPHPKPSYLFALVGGDLDVFSDRFKTASGRKVDLNIYVEKGKAGMASFAMDALKRSMLWDEQVYGREYDLDVFNIVAVSDFNMGAMENKGLNIFNDKYVLADPKLATDTDFMHIEAIIAHEYFHNWTGNRVTCRDWFQLCLKEGLTVYRDQEFSADTRSRAVQRIQQVRVLKAGQFPEDAGPLAHSVRPAAYREINNFYTATVYQKGAELVRMLATLVGPKTYRKATDLYFKRHDGEAAIVEDWLKSFEDTASIDLTQFSRWYGQAGTPVVSVEERYDRARRQYTLSLSQETPSTPGQRRKQIVPIPIRFGLVGKDGKDIEIKTQNPAVREDIITFDRREMSVVFENVESKPAPSLLRAFSAPVNLNFKESETSRVWRSQHDVDLYNRWEALNGFATVLMVKNVKRLRAGKKPEIDQRFVDTIVATAFDETLEPAFRAQALNLPSMQDIARVLARNVDPDAVEKGRTFLIKTLGKALGVDGLALVNRLKKSEARASDSEAAGIRALRNAILPLLVQAKVDDSLGFVQRQFKTASNMTDRLAALSILLNSQPDPKLADAALEAFYNRYEKYPLVVDKWFAAQAGMAGKRGLKRVKRLIRHKSFSLENPNRARSLLAPFAAGNMTGFHQPDGEGYEFYADQIIALDAFNPQIAARLLTLMNNWKMFERSRAAKARKALLRIAAIDGLSRDTQEIVDRALN